MPEEQHDAEVPVARPFWSGTITFGLVAVQVDLFSATRSAGVRLRMLDADGAPLTRRYVCPADGKVLAAEDIVRGWEVEKDRFIVVSDEELEALEPEKSREIDLRLFADAADIPPLLFERAYYLAPAGQTTKAYRLLAETMERTKRVGIATFVMREREYLVAILAEDGILRAETLRFADEVRPDDIAGVPEDIKPKRELRARFERAVAALEADELDPAELEDERTEALRTLIEGKLDAREDVVEIEAEPTEDRPVDLVAVIRERLRRADAERGGDGGGRKDEDGREDDDGRDDDRDALGELSKAELMERARHAGIPGRSRMSRNELLQALRQE